MNPATKPATDQLELAFGSELPTEPHAERSATAARAVAATLAEEEDVWCDSEAPTGVAAERPLLPRPARTPQL